MMPVTFDDRAKDDLQDIWDHLAIVSSPRQADKVIDRIHKACEDLVIFPESGRPREESNLQVRSVPVGRYLVFYRVSESAIEIMRVLYGTRDLEQYL